MDNASIDNAKVHQDTIVSSINSSSNNEKSDQKWKITAIVAAIVAILGVGFGIFQTVNQQSNKDEIADLHSKIELLQEQLNQKAPDNSEVSNNTPQDNESANVGETPSRKYLEPKGWNVRFAYPDGVTDVKYSVQDSPWDGTLVVSGITKNGKTYDVNLFGGQDSYHHYPFFLGEVARWNDASPSDSWSGSIVDMNLIFTNGDYKYYAWDKGNGYETGDAAVYDEACRIVGELFRNIEAR